MKLNLIIGVLCCVFSANKLQADQLEWITKEQAIAAVEYLQQQEAVIIWCGCCEYRDWETDRKSTRLNSSH